MAVIKLFIFLCLAVSLAEQTLDAEDEIIEIDVDALAQQHQAETTAFGEVPEDEGDEPEIKEIVEGFEPPKNVFTEDDESAMADGSEDFVFQTEVNRMMEILIHSLYSHREIFLREMISNAVDALDKVRYLHLTEGIEEGQLEIRVRANPETRTLEIADTGIGMSRQDLIENLGTVAKSGTSRFLDAFNQTGENLNLIGQFGVGFYSSYLVSDEVVVVSKNDKDDKQHVWRSTADGKFKVAEDPRGVTLEPRGTSILLRLKEDADDFLNPDVLENTIQRFSEFTTYPIYLYKKTEIEEEVPIVIEEDEDEDEEDEKDTEEKGEEDEEAEGDEDLEVTDEDIDEDEEIEYETIHKTVFGWERVNDQPPIWTRGKNDVTEQEHIDFYQALTKNTDEPMTNIHFSAEGEIMFKCLLYVPGTAPRNLYDDYYAQRSSMRLYVRRVLINDEFEDFMPNYLHFIKGLVDSNDLPLNVNREQLAKSKVMDVISRKVTKKALEMIRKLADASEPNREEEDEEEDEDEEVEEGAEEDKGVDETYFKFYDQYSKSIKLGILEDSSNRSLLKKLLRYQSTKSDGELISFETYIERMSDEQPGIYFISGDSVEALENSPQLEKLLAKGYEVLYFLDPLDEYISAQISEYEGHKLMSSGKEGMDLGDESNQKRKIMEEKTEEYDEFLTWMKDLLGDKVQKVTLSDRLVESPCVLVTPQYGPSARMAQIMSAQALSAGRTAMTAKKVLEINHRHPLIKEMKNLVDSDPESDSTRDFAHLMYDSALLYSGFMHDDIKSFSARINRILRLELDVPLDAEVDEEEDFEIDDDEVEDDEAEAEDLDEGDEAPEDTEDTDDDDEVDEDTDDEGDEGDDDDIM